MVIKDPTIVYHKKTGIDYRLFPIKTPGRLWLTANDGRGPIHGQEINDTTADELFSLSPVPKEIEKTRF